MSAALAHELNQPLTAMMLYLHAAVTACERSSVGLPGMALSLIEKANNEAERAASIIQRMRELVEHREPLRRHIEVDVLLRETVALTLSGCALDTQIRCDVESQLPPILVDPVQIQQVVFNLLRNALEAVSQQANRQVRVSARRHSGTIQIAVEDNGTGISPERTAKLFKGFADVDAEMGLSLAISRSIAQNHRGDLSVDPGGDGRGARFTLHLPIPAEDDS
jgi:two-component system sensor kinase FixL